MQPSWVSVSESGRLQFFCYVTFYRPVHKQWETNFQLFLFFSPINSSINKSIFLSLYQIIYQTSIYLSCIYIHSFQLLSVCLYINISEQVRSSKPVNSTRPYSLFLLVPILSFCLNLHSWWTTTIWWNKLFLPQIDSAMMFIFTATENQETTIHPSIHPFILYQSTIYSFTIHLSIHP